MPDRRSSQSSSGSESGSGETSTLAPRLVYSDEHLAVVDKPAGLVVHPAPSHRGTTLVEQLGDLLGGGSDPERPGIVHRLDRDTSGLMLVARNDEAVAALQAQIQARQVERLYLALVGGRPESRTGTVEAPIGRSTRNRQKMAVGGAGARQAVTHFEALETLTRTALLRVRLETGRTHQIRVHMAAIGHPVAGDRTYGGAALYGLERQFLHAEKLEFTHPVTGAAHSFASELPGDLGRALELARSE